MGFRSEVLCVFGRGIEKVNGAWQPTAMIERLENNQHPGVRTNGISANDDDERIVIAGAELNVLAAVALYREAKRESTAPRTIVFAAGRPKYIADDPDPDLTEGGVLRGVFLAHLPDCEAEIVLQTRNRNTRDDLLETLRLAVSHGYASITIVSVQVHLPRCREFLHWALKAYPELARVEVQFVASEHVVAAHWPERALEAQEVLISRAYARTAERERKGIEDLRAGRYDFGTQGYSFAPTARS